MRRSRRDTLSWLQRSPDELTVMADEPSTPLIRAISNTVTGAPAAALSDANPASAPEPISGIHARQSFDSGAGPLAHAEERTLFESAPELGGSVVAVLIVVDGELAGEVFRVREGNNSIGRSSRSDVVLSSRWVSREHAILRWHRDAMRLTAISDKPTRVNGTAVSRENSQGLPVADGDTIQLGRTSIRVRTVN